MRKYIEKNITQKTLDSIICDCCNKEYSDVMELQEFFEIDFIGGYGSVFGDGSKVEADICQSCAKEKLGEILRIKNRYERR